MILLISSLQRSFIHFPLAEIFPWTESFFKKSHGYFQLFKFPPVENLSQPITIINIFFPTEIFQ